MKNQSSKFTAKQAKFIEVYAGNNAEAARLAGYKGNNKTLSQVGAENLEKPGIAEAIQKRQDKALKPLIASRVERQEFWTKKMKESTDELIQLKASELLGKSFADFTNKIEVSGGLDLLSDEELIKIRDELRASKK